VAFAVQQTYPGTKLAIGPAIDGGYYYDFDSGETFSSDDFQSIEEKMARIIEQDIPFERETLKKEDAIRMFRKMGEPYKVEMLGEIEDEEVSIYRLGEFVDLCRGPHLPSSGKVNAYKILNSAGAYWRGDETSKMLQRLYGTAFPTAEQLESFLDKLEEARARDHRTLGKQLSIFTTGEKAGPGLIYWQPNGAIIRKVIERFWEDEHVKRGYQLVCTPHIAKDAMFKTSGHYDFFRENMYVMPIDEDEYVLKPMNCPGHILIYQTKLHSYRDLPVRYAELGTVYRYERTGTLHGMLRVRGFTQDDAHIFCTPEQLPREILEVLNLAQDMLNTFGYQEFEVDLSVRDPQNPQDYAGDESNWEMAEGVLVDALHEKGWDYTRRKGEAVFYGPKLDIKMIDALGRGWQGPTVQFDFNLPPRCDVNYIGPDSKPHNVVMVHRTVLGSMERFVGGLIEHYAGAFPLWLAPVQARIIPITDRHAEYGQKVAALLAEENIRVDQDPRSETVSFKVRQGQEEKIPYLLVVGDREVEARTASVRKRGEGNLGPMELEKIVLMFKEEIDSRR
jgi:threonyl-tRNA synthetase